MIDVRWNSSVPYLIHMHEKGPGPWGSGFETQFPTHTFVDLKSGIEYEAKALPKTADGEGESLPITIYTNETGHTGNVILLPKR